MSPFSKNITLRKNFEIQDEEFFKLRDLIYDQSGIYIRDSRKYLLENRLYNRVKENNLKSFYEYYFFLRYDPGRVKELHKLFEVITTNETSFFRNPPQLKVFQDEVLKDLIQEKKANFSKDIHIWSAGCSTGEEPYTLSIILHEVLGKDISRWNIKITANDLSPGVLASARKGEYASYSLRTAPPEIVKKYFFEDSSGRFVVRDEVKSLVDFSQINLIDRIQLKKVPVSDAIFCRNVIIYFDDEMKKNVISSFYDNLHPGGSLFVGHSESLHSISRAFKPVQHTGTIVYIKER